MKKNSLVLILVFLTMSSFLQADSFLKKATNMPVLVQEGKEKKWCPVCGMKIGMFYKTSHSAELNDGTKRQYCSIRCLAVDIKNNSINLKSIKVVDAKTEKHIDANNAYYVVNSKIPGTMSRVSKLAFLSKKDALDFQKKYNGKLVDFKTALSQAKESLSKDIQFFTKKKEKKVYPKGKKLFKKMCNQNIDISKYTQINQLKSDIVKNKLCKKLKEKQLQAVSLYLWEVTKSDIAKKSIGKIVVSKEEKCPVCGMFTYKYPRWAAQIYFTHGDHDHHFSFDGVKDLMKFYLEPEKWGNYEYYKKGKISKILVTDYYTQKAIDAREAYYVINSDIYGPMGYEFIPFGDLQDAKTFKKDHFGSGILKFDAIIQ